MKLLEMLVGIFLQAGCPFSYPTNSVKAMKGQPTVFLQPLSYNSPGMLQTIISCSKKGIAGRCIHFPNIKLWSRQTVARHDVASGTIQEALYAVSICDRLN